MIFQEIVQPVGSKPLSAKILRRVMTFDIRSRRKIWADSRMPSCLIVSLISKGYINTHL